MRQQHARAPTRRAPTRSVAWWWRCLRLACAALALLEARPALAVKKKHKRVRSDAEQPQTGPWGSGTAQAFPSDCRDPTGKLVTSSLAQSETGNLHFGHRNWAQALACYGAAVQQDPNQKSAAVNIGLVYAAQGDYHKALSACAPLEHRFKNYGTLEYCLGLGYMGTKRHAEAVKRLEAVHRFPDGKILSVAEPLAESYAGLANDLLDQGRHVDARQMVEKAIQLQPGSAKAYKTQGFILRHMGLHDAGLESFKKSLELHPRDPEGWANLGLVQGHMGHGKDAVDSFNEAIRLHPGFVGAYAALGKHLQSIHHTHEAIATFEKALALSPQDASLNAGIMQAIADACAWDKRELYLTNVITQMGQEISSGSRRPHLAPFDALIAVPAPPVLVRRLAEAYAKTAADEVSRAGATPLPLPHAPKRKSKLKIGYFSSDFGNTPVGRLIASVPLLHRSRADVQATIYALNPKDGSYYRELVEQGSGTVSLSGLDNQRSAQRIASDGTHILVDLLGYTAGAYAMAREHIVAMRPAPITVGFLGYPGTIGMQNVPNGSHSFYSVVDPVIVSLEMTNQFTEKLMFMPDSYQVNNMKVVEELAPKERPTRASEGLPENAFVFAHFNTLRKVDSIVFDVWMNILHRTPGSVLWLLHMPRAAVERLKDEAAARGVRSSRLVFSDPVAADLHLRRCGLADLFLDSLHYNAHTTATDALWAGVPIVTLPGDMMQSRVAAGLVEAAGLPELVVTSLKEYEDYVVSLAQS